jgi:multiple sugar transport system substrate-binding protein
LAACGSGGGGGGAGGGTISVVMAAYSSKTQPYWTQLVSRFEQKYPKIHVNLRVIDWNTLLQQVPTMIQTGSYPDVLNFNAYSTFASSGLLRPAQQVLSPSVLADFVPSFRQSDSLKGTEYGIPWIASVRALGYNKQAFTQAGIAAPPTTWAQYEADAKALKKAGYTGACVPLGSEEAQAEWSLWMWSNGGAWTTPAGQWSINSPKNQQTMQFLRTLANTDKVTEADPGKTDRTAGCWTQFAEGHVGMTEIMPLGTFSTSIMKGSKVQWGSAPWPRSSAAVPQFTLGVQDVLMAFKRAGNTGMVKSFLDFVYAKNNYTKFVEAEGFLPTTSSGGQAMRTDPVTGPGIALLPKAKFYPLTNASWNKVQSAVQSQLGSALDPGASPSQVLGGLQQIAQSAG